MNWNLDAVFTLEFSYSLFILLTFLSAISDGVSPLPKDNTHSQPPPLQFPPWIIPLREEPYEDHEEMIYGYDTYMDHFTKLNEKKRKELASYQPSVSNPVNTRPNTTYGFKVKQLQPVGYHNGRAYTYFYMHSHHMDIPPVLLNALRRTSLSFLRGGAVTALRIPGMLHEFYSIAGVRELYFELIHNLRQITLRDVPKNATFTTPIIGSFRIKGPMAVVAGHMQFSQSPSAGNSSNEEDTESLHYPSPVAPDSSSLGQVPRYPSLASPRVQEAVAGKPVKQVQVIHTPPSIINPNQYICSVAAGHFLHMDVKIENVDSHGVMPEWGFESSGRDIDSKGFIHFPASVNPIETFAVRAQRRGISMDLLGEIVTVEIQTDGTRSPRSALLESTDVVLQELLQMQWALYNNCHAGEDGSLQDEFQDEDIYLDKDRYTNVPWNPYKTEEQHRKEAVEFLQQDDVVRQYAIDPTSEQAKKELQSEWKATQKRLKQQRETSSAEVPPSDIFPPDQSRRTFEPSRWVLENPFGNILPEDLDRLSRSYNASTTSK
ncbi:Dna-directed Rna polymerase alpha chain rpoA [Cardiosporidium cionae]|uniref:Dna-directed Rna polymerase alpha chain rpoA n=1 Tax=Cardiosporidium cionae TaxID=476202 RepID=A0ABQ7J8I1_9APIC|nr:Dna-directed Rna polymerase alpha chain rpoA [Cardiosporidium cionae]|eukprot:KAF8820278.1 Dna-directed Rna polymerase alpha chain rpoA [Cardiosporidium cionae]